MTVHTERWKEELKKLSLLFSRPIEPEEWDIWRRCVGKIPDNTITYASENWQRNGKWFPKPKEILDICEAYRAAKILPSQVRYAHHGEGYNEGDMMALWKIVSARAGAGRKMTQAEIWQVLDEIDAKRPEGAPEWRR
jgi:hypothetical protein